MKKLFKQIAAFTLVGLVATAIDFSIYFVLTYLGLYHLLSATIAFILATLFNYRASLSYVFESKFKDQKNIMELILFVLLSVIGLALTVFFLWLFVDYFKLSHLLGKILATAIVMVWNFVSRKLLIENKSPKGSSRL